MKKILRGLSPELNSGLLRPDIFASQGKITRFGPRIELGFEPGIKPGIQLNSGLEKKIAKCRPPGMKLGPGNQEAPIQLRYAVSM